MRIQTRENSNVVWLSSGEGVINGTMSLSAPALERILQAVNEKYGTSFEGWSQKPTVYEVGDTVPDWNAYEKIEYPSQKIAVKVQSGGRTGLMCGTLFNKVFNMLTNGQTGLIVNENGIVLDYSGPPVRAVDSITSYLSLYGLVATQVTETIVEYPVGEEIPQWEEYNKYM